MLRRILPYGLIAGLITGVPMVGGMILMKDAPPDPSTGMLIGYATMLVALSLVFIAVKRHRDEVGGGVIKFMPAFGMGLAISAVAGLVYVLAWELALAITGIDYIGQYSTQMIEQKKAAGVSGEALDKLVRETEAFAAQYRNPLFRMPITFSEIFPVGALVSLVTAAVLRNPKVLPARRAAGG